MTNLVPFSLSSSLLQENVFDLLFSIFEPSWRTRWVMSQSVIEDDTRVLKMTRREMFSIPATVFEHCRNFQNIFVVAHIHVFHDGSLVTEYGLVRTHFKEGLHGIFLSFE